MTLSRAILGLFAVCCCLLCRTASAQSVREAADRKDIEAVRRAIRAQGVAGVNQADPRGTTPLHVAANEGLTEIAKLLIEAGADVNAHGDHGWTPMHYALSSHYNSDVVELLAQHGASMEALTDDGNMPIHVAARDGGKDAVAYAIVFGSEVDARNRDGNTPLAVAAWYGRADAAKMLIGAGADIHSKNNVGSTPLDEALRAGKSEMATIITNHELDLQAFEALRMRRASYWPNVRTSYANWRNPRAVTKTVYKNDFSTSDLGPEWLTLPTPGSQNAPLRISTTPKGSRRFLGDFGSQSVRLKLDSLPGHQEMAVTFDLFIIRTMDGNDMNYGPDHWSLSVLGGAELLNTTFANTCAVRQADKPLEFYKNLKLQAYPGEYPVAHNQICTDAEEVNTLGYRVAVLGRGCDMDAVYKIRYTFPHTETSATLNFSAMGLEALDNESWGIASLEVSVDSIPPPVQTAKLKPPVPTPHPAASSAKSAPTLTRAAVAHKPSKPTHKLAPTKRKATVQKSPPKKTAAGKLHETKKPLTP